MIAALSNCEKSFLSETINSKQSRLDGRDSNEFRKVKITFGLDYGSVHVSLGETKVLAQVTCEVGQPKSTRPNEGLLYIKVDIGRMAAPYFEANRFSELSVHVNRILERALKDSRCIDLESLCLVAEEKVWHLRVDLNVLNHEGNIIDCASIAALTALAHFKRPDITTTGDEFIIHSHAEKDPIPIPIHHYPVCISYAIFNNGEIAVADPTEIEERGAEASLVFGLNSYRELCGIHFGGITLTSSQLLLQCATRGAKHAKYVVDVIKEALQLDEKARSENRSIGFAGCIQSKKFSTKQDRLNIKLKDFTLEDANNENIQNENPGSDNSEIENETPEIVANIDATSAILVPSKWIPESDCEQSQLSSTDSEPQSKKKKNKKNKKTLKEDFRVADVILIDSNDSEEESTLTLNLVDD